MKFWLTLVLLMSPIANADLYRMIAQPESYLACEGQNAALIVSTKKQSYKTRISGPDGMVTFFPDLLPGRQQTVALSDGTNFQLILGNATSSYKSNGYTLEQKAGLLIYRRKSGETIKENLNCIKKFNRVQ